MFTNFNGNVANGSRKKPLDFHSNADHVTLVLGYRKVWVASGLWLLSPSLTLGLLTL